MPKPTKPTHVTKLVTHDPDVTQIVTSPSKDLSDAVTLRDLIRDGHTVAEAGRQLGISRSTAFRRLSLIEEDIDRGVINLLTAKGLDFAENWIKAASVASEKGDHRPAKDALLHAKAIDPVADGSQGGTRIAIIIGTPESPIRMEVPRILDLSPVDNSVIGEGDEN